MQSLFKSVVRGYRRLAAHIGPAIRCPICLDGLPVIGLPESTQQTPETHVKLACRHKFCTQCLLAYVEMKLKARQVEDDQWICPVVECKATLHDDDIAAIGGSALLANYKKTLQRIRDEKDPDARWCPRPNCGELIMCDPTERNFTCPKCDTKGCFRCRGNAHRFWFCTRAEDDSYLAWERGVGSRRAVRACPRCRIRIWKTEGCNHMTCTQCRHEYCWVCDSPWDPSHYACAEIPFLSNWVAGRYIHQALGYMGIAVTTYIICRFGFFAFVGSLFALRVTTDLTDWAIATARQHRRRL
ncbi:hypothetical protein ATCC90586_004764 [Pythium insidiosum]|nr:hypothetical protein ATCC90586_004764 [Pythium insidiosum]